MLSRFYDAGTALCANFATRVKRGTTQGLLVGASFAGISSGGTAMIMYTAKKDDSNSAYLTYLCDSFKCNPCSVALDLQGNPYGLDLACPSAANRSYVENSYYQHTHESADEASRLVSSTFQQSWALIAVLPAALGFGLGFINGFIKHPPASQEPLRQPLMEKEPGKEMHAEEKPRDLVIPINQVAQIPLARNPAAFSFAGRQSIIELENASTLAVRPS